MLDGLLIRKPPQFKKEHLLDYIVQLVVSEDEAFQLVDKPSFRQLILYCRPALTECDIPRCTKVWETIMEWAETVIQRVKTMLKDIDSKVSLTFNTWTLLVGDPFIGVTAHYINSQWELKSEQLAFTPLEGDHSGANIRSILIETIDTYGLWSKMGWITADNATNNDTAIKTVSKALGKDWNPIQHRVHCMEHSLHLGAWHFVEGVVPTPVHAVLKKVHNTGDLDDLDEDELESHYDAGDEEDGGDDEAAEQFTVGDTIGKALAIVTQIRKSPQARAFFQKCCIEAEVPTLELLKWIRTRWASLFHFLDRILKLQEGVNRFTLLADSSSAVPNLKGKSYSNFKLDDKEWKRIALIHEVLQEPANAQQSFSLSTSPTVWHIIPTLKFLQDRWESMACISKFAIMSDAIKLGLENLQKWYRKTDDTEVYFICLGESPPTLLAKTLYN